MAKKEYNRYFWLQFDGLVRAKDLPQDYKIYDERICCVNQDCYFKEKCLFARRYANSQLHYASLKREMKDVIRDQQGWKREEYDKHFPKLHYRGASFAFYKEQYGAKPCIYYEELGV